MSQTMPTRDEAKLAAEVLLGAMEAQLKLMAENDELRHGRLSTRPGSGEFLTWAEELDQAGRKKAGALGELGLLIEAIDSLISKSGHLIGTDVAKRMRELVEDAEFRWFSLYQPPKGLTTGDVLELESSNLIEATKAAEHARHMLEISGRSPGITPEAEENRRAMDLALREDLDEHLYRAGLAMEVIRDLAPQSPNGDLGRAMHAIGGWLELRKSLKADPLA